MTETGTAGATPRLMIVDDEECIRTTVRELFSFEGLNVAAAASGEDCLDQLRAGFRGIILMDVMMPGKDGWDTIRSIQHEGLLDGNIILMLTALDAPDERMDGLQELVLDYITKPFSPEEIFATVRTYLRYLDDAENAEA
jgi:DNA-binding response OmpR family regulator